MAAKTAITMESLPIFLITPPFPEEHETYTDARKRDMFREPLSPDTTT